MTIKSRQWRAGPVSGSYRTIPSGSLNVYDTPGELCSERVETFSHSRRGNGWSGGGAFKVIRNVVEVTTPHVRDPFAFSGAPPHIDGTVRLKGIQGAFSYWPKVSHPSDSSLIADGTHAIAATEPLNPAFDLSVQLGELRAEGLPNLPGSSIKESTRIARNAGSEYLNLEFGWLPLVSGVRDFAHTVENSDDILRKFQESANRPISRSYEWPEETTARTTSNLKFVMEPPVLAAEGSLYERTSVRKWFEAEYQFYLPTGGTTSDKFRRYGSYARKLYGLDLSPEVLWNLSPWSWAVDWFSTTGDVIHNISAIGRDGLVVRHAYLMCHSLSEKIFSGTWKGNRETYYFTRRELTETKSRIPATPYGFGVTFASLSAKQVAILSALGLSRW